MLACGKYVKSQYTQSVNALGFFCILELAVLKFFGGGWGTAALWRRKRQPQHRLRNADSFRTYLVQERSWKRPQVTNSLDKDKIYVLDIHDCWLEKASKA